MSEIRESDPGPDGPDARAKIPEGDGDAAAGDDNGDGDQARGSLPVQPAPVHLEGGDTMVSAYTTALAPRHGPPKAEARAVAGLPHETPVLTLRGGTIRLEPIGEMVERVLGGSPSDSAECLDGTHVLGCHLRAGCGRSRRLTWSPVGRVHRREHRGDLLEIRCSNGRATTCADGHGMFLLPRGRERRRRLGKGDATPRPASTLKPGDPLIVPFSRTLGGLADLGTVPVFEMIASHGTPLDLAGANEWAEACGLAITRDERKLGRIPVGRALGLAPPPCARFSTPRGHHPIPLSVPADSLLWVLGLYAAEGSLGGHAPYGMHVVFSLGAHEDRLLEHLRAQLLRLGVPGDAVGASNPHPTAVNVCVYSPPLALLLRDVLKVGGLALAKRVPDIVFNSSAREQRIFLDAFGRGDGCRQAAAKRTSFGTSSPRLRAGIEYLLSLGGIAYSVSKTPAHEGEICGRKCKVRDAWQVYVYDGQEGAQSPIRGCAVGDVSTVDVREVVRVPRDRGWVYDLTVPASGNFVAGESPFLHRAADDDSA